MLLDVDVLRAAIQDEYAAVANDPGKGFHFHTGRFLTGKLGYPSEWVDSLPETVVESFAGVGNPFSWGSLEPGETVVDLGSGAGFDAVLAARMVGPAGHVIGIDMTPTMIDKARHNARQLALRNLEFREGYLEALPVADGIADVVISNEAINLCPDKASVLAEAFRVLKPGGRMQLADIVVTTAVPEDAKQDIALWTG
jgi:SAM-dependent methyltransferase